MSAWDGLNRRKFPRINYPCLITIRNEGEHVDALLTHTENVGMGGVGVIIKSQLKMFAPVGVELDMMDMEDHLRCEGRVVWSIRRKESDSAKPFFYDVGIEFVNMQPTDQERLERTIRQLLKKHPLTP